MREPAQLFEGSLPIFQFISIMSGWRRRSKAIEHLGGTALGCFIDE
jgi:hypothetical protein